MKDKIKEWVQAIAALVLGGYCLYGVNIGTRNLFEKFLGHLDYETDNSTLTFITIVAMVLTVWVFYYVYKEGKESAKREYERQIEHIRKQYEEQNNGTADQ